MRLERGFSGRFMEMGNTNSGTTPTLFGWVLALLVGGLVYWLLRIKLGFDMPPAVAFGVAAGLVIVLLLSSPGQAAETPDTRVRKIVPQAEAVAAEPPKAVSAPAPQPEPVVEPVVEPVAAAPVAAPVAEPAPEPAPEPIAAPVAAPAPAEPVAEAAPAETAEAAPRPPRAPRPEAAERPARAPREVAERPARAPREVVERPARAPREVVERPARAPREVVERPARAPRPASVEGSDVAPVAAPLAAMETPTPVSQPVTSAGPVRLAAPRGGNADDLKEIEGIGPAMEKLVNGLGFYHFDQIAGWSDADVEAIDAEMKTFKGRIARDRWVAQARIIVTEGLEAFRERAKTNNY
jgi:predicted flap endonuclease-1-like 5' DNA nuclease